MKLIPLIIVFVCMIAPRASAQNPVAHKPAAAKGESTKPGNPVLDGWYADPEAVILGNRYWIFPTYSAPYDEQTFIDAFSSSDLATWTRHPRVPGAGGA